MTKINSLTGMPDLHDSEDKNSLSSTLFLIEKKLKKIFTNFNYKEIRTPILEQAELFLRSVGSTSDIVNKEIYSFKDRNNKTIALRPEGTASVIRSIIERKLENTTHKLWYLGPMWRYERPQKGRYRQFNQAGVEILGIPEGLPEFETISLICSIIQEFNLKNCLIKINHLGSPHVKEKFSSALVSFLNEYEHLLDEKDKLRLKTNPLRVLDTKNLDTKKILKMAPSIKDFIDQKSLILLEKIKNQFSDICKIDIDYSLVRGLDYYSVFVFESISIDLGAQDSFLGGGRYDQLSMQLGGKEMPSIGFAIGLERLSQIVDIETEAKIKISFIIATGNLEEKAYKISHHIRRLNDRVVIDCHLQDGSLKSKLRKANKNNSDYAIIIGEQEIENNTLIIKSLKDEKSDQKFVSFDELNSFFQAFKKGRLKMNKIHENNGVPGILIKYKNYLFILLVAIFLLIIFVFTKTLFENKNNELAAEIYNEWELQLSNVNVDNDVISENLFNKLMSEYSTTGYARIALLKQASIDINNENFEKALSRYLVLIDLTDGFKGNKLFNKIARINSARLYYNQEQYDDALLLLEKYTTQSTDAIIHELIVDILKKQEKYKLAREQYNQAKDKYTENLSLSIINMKLSTIE